MKKKWLKIEYEISKGMTLILAFAAFFFFFEGVDIFWKGFHNIDLAVNALAFAYHTETPPSVYLKWRDRGSNNCSLSYSELYILGMEQIELSVKMLSFALFLTVSTFLSYLETAKIERKIKKI